MLRDIPDEDKERVISFIKRKLVPSRVQIGIIRRFDEKHLLKNYWFVKRLTQDGKEVRYDVLEAQPLGRGNFGEVHKIWRTYCEQDKEIVPIETSLNRVAKIHRYDSADTNEESLSEEESFFESQFSQKRELIKKETKNAHKFDQRFKTQLYTRYAYSIMMEAKGKTLRGIINARRTAAEKIKLIFQPQNGDRDANTY